MMFLGFLLMFVALTTAQRFYGILPPNTLGETEPVEGPCPCILSCCRHPLQIRRAPGLPVNALSFSYECCGCIECPPNVPIDTESEFPVVANINGQLVELDVEAR